MERLFFCCLLAACLARAEPARAWDSPAPDVVLYCTPAMQAPLHDIAARYTAETRVPVQIFVGSPDGQAGLIVHRARADVLIAEKPVIDRLEAQHLLRAGSIVAIGADPFVLIGKAGWAPAETPLAQLVATHAIVVTDNTTAASFDGAAVLRTALPGAAPARMIGVADTPDVIATVSKDAVLLGLVNRTEAAGDGISLAGALAAPPVPIGGALTLNGQSRNSGALLAYIAGPKGREILRRAGLEIAS